MDWQQLYDRLYAVYGDCVCPLVHDSPFQLLAAVMLSAQCKDERVNQVTGKLFAAAPDAPSMAALEEEKIAEIIKPCGLYGAKSKNLKGAAQMIVERFNGQVPENMEELVQLPGIGRKSANVLLGNAFDTPGFPVDTHVKRLLNRLGAVKTDDPEKIEKIVNRAVPAERWTNFSHLLIFHGRAVCHARTPLCGECVLAGLCAFNKRKK
ncbi:MAG: endonuclease III [Lentisphaeria bacterium]|nr:endonuclease III [Lentisphaeria bacterium]